MAPSSLVTRISKDKRGNVAVTFGLAVIPAVMFIGGAVDFGNAYKTKQKIQAAADAAVLAAAAMPSETAKAARETRALNIFNANVAGMPGITPVANANGSTITVTAQGSVDTSFLKIANIDVLKVSGNSSGSVNYTSSNSTTTTTTSTNGKVCLLALDPANTVEGFSAQGTPNVYYENCWAHTNSTKPGSNNSGAINGGGAGAIVVGAGTSAVGGKSPDADAIYAPDPVTGAGVIADPFATFSAYTLPYSSYATTFTAPATPETCKASSLNLKKNVFELEPGRYCGGITVMANATVTFKPGEYIIENGMLNFQSGAKITGTDVLFYLKGAASTFQIIGSGNGGYVRLKGRTSGSDDLKGFVLIAHASAGRGLTSRVQGGTEFEVEGMIYAPTQHVEIIGGGVVNAQSNFFSMIAKSFQFQGNGRFDLKNWSSASNMPNLMPNKPLTTTTTTTTSTQVIDKVKLN